MALRVTWRGSLNVSLVSVAVKAYTASAPENGQLRLNQLHDACHGRIKYEKTCPVHGPVTGDQIVMGYFAAPGSVQVVLCDTLLSFSPNRIGTTSLRVNSGSDPKQRKPRKDGILNTEGYTDDGTGAHKDSHLPLLGTSLSA